MGEPPPFVAAYRALLARHRRAQRNVPGATSAAVLIALFEGEAGAPHLWLIRRPSGLRIHAGQVALPGGKRDSSDADLAATALREANEEIGLPSGIVDVLGAGDDLVTGTGYVVTPVVGWVREPFDVNLNPREATRAFTAPLAVFAGAGIFERVPFERLKRWVRVHRFDGEIIWGATAQLLGEIALLLRAEPPH